MVDLKVFSGKRVLMLIGPESPFFYRLAKDIGKYAEKVYKINLSGGCWIFFPTGAINYRGKPSEFSNFLVDFVEKEKIDTVIMFNDGKLIHRIARNTLKDSVKYFSIEKGYIRPDFITFEEHGVNGNSPLIGSVNMDTLINYRIKPVKAQSIGIEYPYLLLYSIVYYIAFVLLKPLFPSSSLVYRNINRFALGRILGAFMQIYYKISQGKYVINLVNKLKGKYYFVPLQVHNDVQIKLHSPYKDITFFIEEVIQSFSKNAPNDTYLIFKHHPIDLGYRDYKRLIEELSEKYSIKGRIFYIKTGDINQLIENSIGVITINSTVGMSTLMHLKPLKVMGKAIYDVDGITYKGSLDSFWIDVFNFKPNETLVQKFVNYVMEKALINGSLYKRITRKNHAGVYYEYYEKNDNS